MNGSDVTRAASLGGRMDYNDAPQRNLRDDLNGKVGRDVPSWQLELKRCQAMASEIESVTSAIAESCIPILAPIPAATMDERGAKPLDVSPDCELAEQLMGLRCQLQGRLTQLHFLRQRIRL